MKTVLLVNLFVGLMGTSLSDLAECGLYINKKYSLNPVLGTGCFLDIIIPNLSPSGYSIKRHDVHNR